jgi:hypothetical protein
MTAPRPAVSPARPAMFAALAVPNFRRYVSGQALSLIGTWVETVARLCSCCDSRTPAPSWG